MREFYGQDSARKLLSSLALGQLAAVKAEEEEEFLRAQVYEIMGDKAKVRASVLGLCFQPVGQVAYGLFIGRCIMSIMGFLK